MHSGKDTEAKARRQWHKDRDTGVRAPRGKGTWAKVKGTGARA